MSYLPKIAIALCVSSVVACSALGSDNADDKTTVQKEIGVLGGEINLKGLRLTVPPGALTDPTMVTIVRGLPVPEGQEAGSEVFEIRPASLKLQIPATISIDTEEEDLALFGVDQLGVRNLDANSSDDGLEATIEEFSVVFAGDPNPCGRQIRNDINNCGSCGRSCNNNSGVVSCREGSCEIECDDDHGNCDEDERTGCETDFEGNRENCGACGTVCADIAVCAREDGHSQCECPAGYEGDGTVCEEIDECENGTNDCGTAECRNTDGGFECYCESGYYMGDGQCEDVNECDKGETNNCGESSLCVNTPGSFECQCPAGFEHYEDEDEQYECSDIDECTSGASGCSENASCTNLPGSFVCTCESGYQGDGQNCSDVDECAEGIANCDPNALCTNTPGYFSCSCNPGYIGDGSVCQEVDECQDGTAQCDEHATCDNSPGSFDCSCVDGYQGDGFTCADIDECASGDNSCDDHAECTNHPGSHSCACKPGYEGNGQECTDINECENGVAQCSPDAICSNTPGEFSCECKPGYSGNGFACNDINECDNGENDCHSAHGICSNNPGGFSCQCEDGFSGDGTNCSDIDECALATDNCSDNADCTNVGGGFECDCNPGYSGDGSSCDDIDECETPEQCGEFGICDNSPGSYSCSCPDGFTQNGDECVDIDECLDSPCSGDAACENTPGSFTCACDHGYVGDGLVCNDSAERVIKIEAGGAHTCALYDNHRVRCWGWGIYGELGQGNTDDIGVDNEPKDSPYLQFGQPVRDINLGVTHGCAILEDNTMRCWGRNFYGALGLGDTNNIGDNETPESAPPAIDGWSVSQVSGGGEHTCIIDSYDKVYCFGLGIDGQLGYGSTESLGDDENPRPNGAILLFGAATDVVAGRDHTCVLQSDGSVWCWGRGEHGATGYGHTNNIGDDELPIVSGAISLGESAKQLAAGWYHTCALTNSGDVRCWGYGNMGALGYGNRDSIGDDESPDSAGTVDVGAPVKQIVAGTYHTCALLETGKVRCWGFGGDGQLGYANTQTVGDDEHPYEMGNVDVGGTVTQLTAGSFHTCALLESGAVRCWGKRDHGQLCYIGTDAVGDDEHPSAMGDCPILRAVCPPGKRLGTDLVTCEDIDECAEGSDACHSEATCENTDGSYDCTCGEGYSGDGFSCEDVDECADGSDGCSDNADCRNTIGSFECTCNPGYFGDGISCVGACEANEDQCSDNADCTDNGADYSCACLPGFEGDGFTCTDINECARGIAECAPNAGCVNTEGSFECICHEGFVGDGSVCACESGYREIAGTCADINECDLGTDTCLDTELCLNTDGSFQCIGPGAPGEPEPGEPEEPGELVCPDGFVLIGNIVVPGATGLAAASMPGIEFDNDTYSSASNNDTLADAQLITNRSTLRGQVDHSNDELDIFRVTLERGQEISLLIDSGNKSIDLDLHLYHLDGTPVLNPDGTPIRSIGKSSLESLTAGRAGDFLVAVQAAKGASSYSLVLGGQLGSTTVAVIPPKFIPGEVIVTFNPKMVHQKSTIQSAAQTMGMRHTRANLGRASLMRANPQVTAVSTSATDYSGLKPVKDALAMAKLWQARSDVLSATPNYLYQISSVPNDEHYPKQWHYPAINLPQAWDHVPDASGTIVAVIDTGVILSHPDLNDNLVAGFDFISDPNRARDGDGIDSNPDDVGDSATPGQSSYHGTHVAGTISAESNNGIGGAGVAQGARIMPLRVLGAGGGSSYDIMQAIRFAAGLPNDSNTVPSQIADVINLSLGGSGFSPNFQNLIADVRAQGVIIVAAAGNDSSSQLFYPASYDGVISVSATNFENGLSYFSNYGGAIDVAAPGGDMRVDKNGDGLADGIYSTLGSDTSGTIQPSYANYQGTSMASPHVAGVVALMRAANSDLTPQDIDNLLAAGTITTDLGPPGRDNSFGHGLINAEAAVIRAREHVPGAPPELNPVLVSDPPSLSFLDPQITSQILTLSNGGGGSLTIDNPIPSEEWILVELIDTIDGDSRYTITVDRSELAVGSYSATLSATSSANSIQIPVVMQIAAPQCVDIDECEEDIDGCAIPSENGDCRNLPGSFECYCLDGYDGDGVTCQDIDECAQGTDDCSDNAECTNTNPGFSCECLPGFTGDGVECLPPNECELGTDDCDENATCSDTEEGFDCSCNTGYLGDGTVCEDIDECADGSHDCDANAVCENGDGSFTCECSPHFSGDGKTCAIDEGCVSLENFEGTWPNSQWQSPWGNTLDGDLTANAARTGSLGLSTLSERALYQAVELGQEGDKLGVWLRLDDVGSTASLSFASSVAGGFDLRVDGSGGLSLFSWQRSGEMTVVADTFGLIPVGKWLYLDMQFDGSTVNASLLDGSNSVAQLFYNLGVSPIGSPGLLGNGADFDGLTGCAILPEQDECALGIDECDENAICNDLLGGYECVCESGYIGDGFTCTDENECETGTHSCSPDAICTNTIGSYTCECSTGFVGDGIVCTDIDECAIGQFECSSDATCNNTPGSYECVCNAGYEGNGVTCADIDECAIGADDCSEFATCENTPGSFTCECSAGYEGDGRTCLDVDECALGLDSCHDAATCHNQEGSYSCECNGGWQGDGFECNDIDECDLGTDACADNAECQNLPGFYTCTCAAGHSGDGISCDDIDECASGTDTCSEFASCSNTDGAFTCACLPGFEGDGTTCTDINECDTSEPLCGTNAVCQNTQGSFECDCQNGFQGDGITCTDIDECADGNNDCTGPHITCSNTEGSYTCGCDDGFTEDTGSCVDVDECATNAFSCPSESVCANNSGGYDCECQLGYEVEGGQCIDATTGVQSVGAGDLHTCVLMDEGVVKCWGIGLNGRTGHANTATIGDNEAASAASIVNLTTTPAVQLAVGGAHNCILLNDGHVRCWGNGADGRLGYENHEDIGDDEDPIDAGNLPLVGKAVRLALGQKHSCALLENGSVRCWGSNTYGQLGSGPTIFPVDYTQAVDLGAPAIDLVAGDFHTCAILDNGEVYCWGLGSMGRLGYGNTNSVGLLQTPREAGPVSIGGTATAIAAGQNHSCAILSDSTMRCWGRGADGVLGSQGTSNIGDNELPNDMPVLSIDNTLIAVSAGGSHTCILTGSGQVQCFGKGQDGQLGYGNATNIGDNETPSSAGYVDVGNVVEIDAGNKHTCAVLSSGAVRCWGNSSLGQLGYGNTLNIGDTETPASAGDIDL